MYVECVPTSDSRPRAGIEANRWYVRAGFHGRAKLILSHAAISAAILNMVHPPIIYSNETIASMFKFDHIPPLLELILHEGF